MPNDAISIYFADATLASAFIARWCAGSKAETAGGVFQVRRMNRRRGSGRAAPDAVGREILFDATIGTERCFWLIPSAQRAEHGS